MPKRKFDQRARNSAKNEPRKPVCWDLCQLVGVPPSLSTPPHHGHAGVNDGVTPTLLNPTLEDSLNRRAFDQESSCGPTVPLMDQSTSSSIGTSSTSPSTDDTSEVTPPSNPYDGYYQDDVNPLVPAFVDIELEDAPVSEMFLPAQNECGFIPSDSLCLGVELLNMCMHAKVPLDFYERVLRLFKNHALLHVDDDHKTTWKSIPSTRDNLLKQLKSQIPCVQPTCYAVTSTHDIVPKFPFMEQLIDLFSTPFFQDIGACCVNPDEESRFLQYKPPVGEGLSELMGAKWYQETYALRIGDHPLHLDQDSGKYYHNWLCPLVGYNDKIAVSAMEGSYSLEPMMFSLGVLRREIREQESAWRHLGFIPSRSEKKKRKQLPGMQAEQALAFTHECLSILLEDVVAMQKEPPLLTLNLFGKQYNIRLIVEVAFVIGDQLSQDTHCCRKKSNSGGAGRAHRSCLTSFISATKIQPEGCTVVSKKVLDSLCDIIWQYEDCDKQNEYLLQKLPQVHTQRLKKKIIMLMKTRCQVARDILEKVFTLYPVHNAWSDVSFGSNENGIHRAAVDDPMHYNASGLFAYLGKIAFGGLRPAEAEMLEGYMREDFSVRSSVRYDLPRGKFTTGFTNCTLLTSNEKVGIMHALYLSLGTPRVAEIYQISILRQQQKYADLSCFDVCSPVQTSSFSSDYIPKVEDQYFFKKSKVLGAESMKRGYHDVKAMLKSLDTIGLLRAMEEVIPSFDELHTEYLLQIIWDRLHVPQINVPDMLVIPPDVPLDYPMVNGTSMYRTTKELHRKLRQVPVRSRIGIKNSPIPTVIQSNMEKHWYNKPKVSGTGDTTCILTDVKGFRDVLHSVLSFYGLVHEFHELDPQFHADLPNVKVALDELLSSVFSRIYRGDNSVDVQTCKCHAHFHLTWTIEYFGAPMGFDAAKGERNLKFWAKEISKTARKCGQAIFIAQTSQRVADHLVLQRMNSIMLAHVKFKTACPQATTIQASGEDLPKWGYTRKKHHMLYNMEHNEAVMVEYNQTKAVDPFVHLTESIRTVLQATHGPTGNVRIWKEIKLYFGKDQGHNFVRAFFHFDSYGKFFDWVQVKLDLGEDGYTPAKVLLLYRTEADEDRALVWMALRATVTELRQETNISARWKMDLIAATGLPNIVSISTDDINRCILVHEHWKCINQNHLPITELQPGSNTSMFVIDESYDRYSWCLNFIDKDRW
jgi:Plavaka transposase